MSWVHNISEHLARRPAGMHNLGHVPAAMSVRDAYDTFTRNVSQARDVLFPLLARRPMAKACNYAFGTRIAHNSYVDIVMHAVFVGVIAATLANAAGIIFGLSTLAVEQWSLAGNIIWHATTQDGLLRPYFN